MGGLGNQLFIWAYGRGLRANGYDVSYDTTAFTHNSHRQYCLAPFDDLQIDNTSRKETYEGDHGFHPEALHPADGSKMVGYWQTERYFEGLADKLRSEINFRWMQNPLTGHAREIEKEIYRTNGTFLHVRRQDYLNLRHYNGILDMAYYQSAINLLSEKISSNPKIFVFSDDREWCRQNFPADFTIVDGTNLQEDIRLMAGCKHAIASNSTFGWWAAWIGDNQSGRIVIAPDRWFTDPNMNGQDLIPARWTQILSVWSQA